MSIAIKIDVKLVKQFKDGAVEGIMLDDNEVLPFDQPIEEMWVIHPEESVRGTCDECAGLAGKHFGVGEGEMPPIHANCNCERVPVMPTFDLTTMTFNTPPQELSMTKAMLDNMDDEALAELNADNLDPPTVKRYKAIIAERKQGGK